MSTDEPAEPWWVGAVRELSAQAGPAWMAQRLIQPVPSWIDPLQQPCPVSPALAGFQCRHHAGHFGPHEPAERTETACQP